MVKEQPWWYRFAACGNQDPDLFFEPDSEEHVSARAEAARIIKAKKVCNSCPVASVCLDHALTQPERFGVWGSTTPHERVGIQQRIRRQQRRLAG